MLAISYSCRNSATRPPRAAAGNGRPVMRIERTSGANTVAGGSAVRRNGGDGFALNEGEVARGPLANTGVRSIGGIDVLVALQGIEQPGERRRRAVARGRT